MDKHEQYDVVSDREPSWAERAEPLVRWKRLVLGGIVISCALVTLLGALLPKSFEAQATVALPGSFAVGVYKVLERSLTDDALFAYVFGDRLSPGEVASLTAKLDAHLRPLTTAGRDELVRLDKADAITAVQLTMRARTKAAALERINLFADLVRRVVLGNSAMGAMDQLHAQGAQDMIAAANGRMQLHDT